MNDEDLHTLMIAAKRECKITWNNTETENQIKDIVEDAIPAIMHKLGIKEADESDLLKPGMARRLFLKFCLYSRNDMLEEFEHNYIREILTERHRYEVKYGKEETEQLQ